MTVVADLVSPQTIGVVVSDTAGGAIRDHNNNGKRKS